MDMQPIIKYLTDLSENNDREWYHSHKQDYKTANAVFEDLLMKMIGEIGKFDPSVIGNSPAELTFKLVRDTRFSRDKFPYNPCFRAHISSKGKLPIPVGYYVKIMPGDRSFLGGGLFADMFKDATDMVRQHISRCPEEWRSIINAPEFTKNFTVEGSKLKNVPAGFDKENPQAEYLKFKSWYLEYPITDSELENGDEFCAKAVELFRIMKPFNDFLNQALCEFKMPSR